ncbi:sensor histidine kinase [Piscinibacter koreensis]|uniref:histidine kinase n=1 Tax=Piscinibacter koreensis TaxID=2742824 RepID=A0A7Y6NPT7_9BURK|nr:sensor histidine kinase [Schlegelella koreensis]NUZ07089.1 sodium:solute symporter [Schlegelella koreensis]
MLSTNVVIVVALAYVAFLFAVAFIGDRRARQGRPGWLQSPLTYTLSISVYCTSWTYYGAVGSAARSGMEFVAIYLGPTLVFVGWWVLLRKLVRIGQIHRITSIADMISSRYGKSASLAALVTVIAIAASTPYIALQLQAVATSFQVVSGSGSDAVSGVSSARPNFQLAFLIAAGMAFFTIVFGTRNVDANERHHGVVAAIAVEAVVKLVAMMVVGLLVVFGISGGPIDAFAYMPDGMLRGPQGFGSQWATQLFLAATAVICLPRQFQVTVVEITDERHLRTAAWLFPLYLLLISLFVLPIAIAGVNHLPPDANPDMFMLTLPMWAGRSEIALLAFLGGFSAATSMVIVASIALSTMVSNHIILPVALRLPWVSLNASDDVRHLLLTSRRVSICVILLLAFLYFRLSARFNPLASIGLTAFAGAAQLLPCLVGGLFWRQATARGAVVGLAAGALIWAYTLLLPGFQGEFLLSRSDIAGGVFGQSWLRPQALFGLTGLDPLVHAAFWSLSINTVLFVAVSLWREAKPLEQLQSMLFIDVFKSRSADTSRVVSRSAATDDLNLLAQRLIGHDAARQLFGPGSGGSEAQRPVADNALITELERKLAGSVGAASARAMVSQVVTGETISLTELLRIADETQRVRTYSLQLEEQSRRLAATAAELRSANERLTRLDSQKDDFLSQISHEVRTPMSSIRAFSEILMETLEMDRQQSERYLQIIHEESIRMTRLLDGILDLSVLEGGDAPWALTPTDPELALENAMRICHGLAPHGRTRLISGERAAGIRLLADGDRLIQVFINLIANGIKYNDSAEPFVRVSSAVRGDLYEVLVDDNGPGIHGEERERVFSKFSRGWHQRRSAAQGAGLGLAISWQIMRRLGGTLELLPDRGTGACFRVQLRRIAPA